MASTSPSPSSSPPNSATTSSPPPTPTTSSPPSPSDDPTTSVPPTNPNATSYPPPPTSPANSTSPPPPTVSQAPTSPANSTSPPPPTVAQAPTSPANSTSPPPPTVAQASTNPANSTSPPPPTVAQAPTSPANSTSPPPPTVAQAPTSPANSTSPPPPTVAQAPPPTVPSAPPPVSLSPPPSIPVLAPPPTETTPPFAPPPTGTTPTLAPPPTTTPSPPPPVVVSSPPPNSPPPPVSASPPAVTSPPPSVSASPPAVTSPPPRTQPPPAASSPPPVPTPPAESPPPADANSPPPLPSNSPPPPSANPPKSTPAPPTVTPPPSSDPEPATPPSSNPPPSTSAPPPVNQTQPTPSSPSPPLIPSSQPSIVPPPPPQTNGSSLVPTQPIPTQPTEGPTNGSTTPSSPDNANSASSGGMNTGTAVAIGIVVGIVVLGLVGVFVWFLKRQKRKASGYHAGHVMPSPLGSSPVSDTSYIKAYSSAPLIGSASSSDSIYSPPESGVLGNSKSRFTYEELMEVTNGFSPKNILGEGGFGCVYKGTLKDGRDVAVKQLKIGGSQGEREFAAEVETISRVHHRHLVSLVGYCVSDHQRLLVYDYVPNNTLYYHLHAEGRPVMDWATRVKVAIGAARGISYLHEDCHPRIIHRDIKSSNILLDNNFDAQVSDFGLAKLALDADTHITTRVMGTFGYMAPEYASSGKLTEKSDVYSFGVVLLELITGRKSVDASQSVGDESLVEWARPLMSDALANQELEGLIDPKLERNYVESEAFRMIEAAAACVRHSGTKRPRMGQVVRALEGIGDSSDLTNGIRPGQSEVYSSAQQSAEIRMFQRMAFGSQDYNSDMFSRSSWGG